MNKHMKVILIGCCIGLLVALCGIGQCVAQDLESANVSTDYVEAVENGSINWGKGMIIAVGIGAPPANAVNMAQARAMARRAALTVGRRNLLEVVKGVRVDSQTLVRDFVVESDIVMSRVSGVVKNSQPIDTKYMSDGSVEVTVAMPLYGSWNSELLSMLQKKKPSVEPSVPVPEEKPSTSLPLTGAVYTGLVIDAKGLGLKPAMSPKVLDENGSEVYGSAYVSREFAIQQGMVGYARNLTLAQQNSRVTDNPLTVKAVNTSGGAKTDIVVSNTDANFIKGASKNMNFLEKCKVMVVLD